MCLVGADTSVKIGHALFNNLDLGVNVSRG